MILLRRLGLMPNHPQARKACSKLTENGFDKDGGINYFASLNHSETCVTGMILSVLSYFSYRDDRISGMVDFLLDQQMKDGGWNCESFSGARHGSFHTTLSVLEGLREFEKWDSYKQKESVQSRARAHEFLLSHRLYRSHRTGEVVDARMTRFSFPPRWHYDLLRVLDYFQECRLPYDTRMDDAFDILYKKQTKNGTWPLQNRHPGRTYFEIEQPGKPSRWNTLRSLRVMRWYKGD